MVARQSTASTGRWCSFGVDWGCVATGNLQVGVGFSVIYFQCHVRVFDHVSGSSIPRGDQSGQRITKSAMAVFDRRRGWDSIDGNTNRMDRIDEGRGDGGKRADGKEVHSPNGAPIIILDFYLCHKRLNCSSLPGATSVVINKLAQVRSMSRCFLLSITCSLFQCANRSQRKSPV